MTTEFFKDFDQNPFHVLDDHGILMKFFEDFDQNPGSQPLYPTIQMTIKFFLQELGDCGILVKFLEIR